MVPDGQSALAGSQRLNHRYHHSIDRADVLFTLEVGLAV